MAILSSHLRFESKPHIVKYTLVLLFLLVVTGSLSQALSEEDKFISKLKRINAAADGLLASRAAVLFSIDYSQKELESIQKAFQQIGIDAVFYVESERVLAGPDLQNAYSTHFMRRDIKFLIFIRKEKQEYEFFFVAFSAKIWNKPAPPCWYLHSPNLKELLLSVFHTVVSAQKRQNFLINDLPEQDAAFNFIGDSRTESLVPNIKTANIAVPKMRDDAANTELEQYLKENFQVKYEIVADTISDAQLEQKGYHYVLHFIHTRGSLAKEILGYDMSKSESALATVIYPNGTLQLKTIPSETSVYKYYIKNLEDKRLYFGTKWDADITWQEALKNHIDGYRAAGKLN